MKKLPLSNYAFENIIQENYLYVDKTKEAYDIINFSKYVFLSRPRRFGKSMLISTLMALYQGKKELFKGLWIEDKIEWEAYPVIHIDFSRIVSSGTKEKFQRSFTRVLRHIADKYEVTVDADPDSEYFDELIQQLYLKTKKPVVILIDEYDKPITDHLTNTAKAEACREWLREYYAILKGNDARIKQLVITGISKFAKMSIFSVLNNVQDITIRSDFNNVVGFTQSDIIKYFGDYLAVLQKKYDLNTQEILAKIERWYNGYSWDGLQKIYNPYSIVNLFSYNIFKNFWFQSGTPNLLINYIIERANQENIEKDPTFYESINASGYLLDSTDIKSIILESLLFQTGYLTIKKAIIEKSWEDTFVEYILGYPNLEVRQSMTVHILEAYGQIPRINVHPDAQQMKRHLMAGELESFIVLLRRFLALIPYQLREKADEAYYHSIFQLLLTLVGVRMEVEKSTDKGRIDGVLEFPQLIYIIEFKYARKGTMNYLHKSAFKQMKDNKYAEAYRGSDKSIQFLAVGFLEKKAKNKKKKVLEIEYKVNTKPEYPT